jgi:putative SOS response-associated peptidase YedK
MALPQDSAMCNIYQFKNRKPAGEEFRARVVAAAECLPSPVTRKTDPGVVVLPGGGVAVMRWGFRRDFNPAINNTRAEKLDSGMWAAAWRDRRCVIPVTEFWEWGPGTGGRKQAHVIHHPEGDWLWMAGVWKDDPELGPCYSMVTTAASSAMAALHDRMPAIVAREEANAWLKGVFRPGAPYGGELVVEPCASPLAGGGGATGKASLPPDDFP